MAMDRLAAATAAHSPSSAPIKQKRTLDEDHSPSISSPLNPEARTTLKAQVQSQLQWPTTDEMTPKRTKKDTFKKRESKNVDSSRATPGIKLGRHSQHRLSVTQHPSELSPLRYKLPSAKRTDFDPARGPVFVHGHDFALDGGEKVQFFETSDQ